MKCKEKTGGIKAIYIMQMPINLERIDFMSELSVAEVNEVKEWGGFDCVILKLIITPNCVVVYKSNHYEVYFVNKSACYLVLS